MNCIVIDDEELSRKLLEQFIGKNDSLVLLNSFSNPVDALSFLSNNKVDVIFLDIEMPEMNGLEFMKVLNPLPSIILTTSHKEFALDAFEYNVVDFLVKPIVYSRFIKAVQKVKATFEKKEEFHISDDNNVFVKQGSSIVRIKKSDILWVEALGDYIILHTDKDKFTILSTMKGIEEKLPSQDYIRVHRSFIIRIDKIDSIEDNTISYKEKLIPIGKSYREEVFKRLNML